MASLLLWMAQATAVVAVLMFILWLLHFPLRNLGIVDVGWSLGVALIALMYALHGVGYWRRTLILTAMALLWGIRLGFYLLLRVTNEPEDTRYVELLRKKWTSNQAVRFLLFFEAQAAGAGIMSLPFLLAMHDPAKSPLDIEEPLENAGAILWAIAFIGETAADIQLALFKRNPKNKGKVCNTGLWRYSRHPNYFFEFLIWVSFAIVASPAKYGYLGFISPALMFYFLVFVTGIPPSEQEALRTKGDAYRKYQRATSSFVPWFPNYR